MKRTFTLFIGSACTALCKYTTLCCGCRTSCARRATRPTTTLSVRRCSFWTVSAAARLEDSVFSASTSTSQTHFLWIRLWRRWLSTARGHATRTRYLLTSSQCILTEWWTTHYTELYDSNFVVRMLYKQVYWHSLSFVFRVCCILYALYCAWDVLSLWVLIIWIMNEWVSEWVNEWTNERIWSQKYCFWAYGRHYLFLC